MEQAIQDAMKYQSAESARGNTKNLFKGLATNTNAGNWLKDRDWAYRANPELKNAEDKRETFDMKLILKKHHQK